MVKEKKEVVVQGPSRPVTPPEKRAERDAERALEEERFTVLQISDKVGTYFSGLMVGAGALLLSIFAYIMVTGFVDWIAISREMSFLALIVWVFAGIANVVGGLLLMACE